MYVMDDKEKFYLLQSTDNDSFVVSKTIDFSHLNRLRDVVKLRDDDWVNFHMDERTLTFGDRTYNLANNYCMQVKIPSTYFGQQKSIEDENDQA